MHKIKYRNYIITPCDAPWLAGGWEYVHEDYDGAPEYSLDECSADNRAGFEKTLEHVIDTIDEIEDETHGQ
jgi:hypothetical protein